MNSRRTLTYFHSAFDVIVRAPQTRMPRPGKLRIALTPCGFRTSWVLSLMSYSSVERAAHDLVRRRLEHAALGVGARVDAEHVAAGRHQLARAGLRIGRRRSTGSRTPRTRVSVIVLRGLRPVGLFCPCRQSITAKRKRMLSQWSMIALAMSVDRLSGA